ncbi:MAG TPA: sodium:proton antiporter [Patescibacteria group bacterium]|nr:sodium:proton antiporter [Patescibacteria group bacterium]
MLALIEKLEILLLLAALVAMAARRLHLPYSVGLVVAGIGLTFVRPFEMPITKDLIFSVLLPPLIFEAALFIPWKELKRDMPVLLVFVTIGLLLSAALTALGMHYLAGWPAAAAGVFGVLIAATDPVSVIATFKEAGVHGRLRLLVEAESLLNDGTAAVAFVIALAIATGSQAIGAGDIALTVVKTVFGGVLVGGATAGAILFIAGKTEDHLVEITLTMIIAYTSFLVAEHFHFSGVLSCMTAGLLTGNYGYLGAISDKGREAVTNFWEYIAFVANSFIFILIGVHETQQNFGPVMFAAFIAILFVTLGRAVAVYPFAALFRGTKLKVSMKHQHVLFWGGLRGALALGLALGLPEEMPLRAEIVTVTFTVVAFSVFVQGLTMTPLLRRIGEIPHRKK